MGNYQVMRPLQQVQQEQAGLMGHQKLPKLGSWALFWRISGLPGFHTHPWTWNKLAVA